MRSLARAAWITMVVAGCGGQPVGSKVPRPDPTDVAVVAAAAATALTLANPAAAGRKPEQEEGKEPRNVEGSKESVPSDVLDRMDGANVQDERPPCEPAPARAPVGFIPAPDEGTRPVPRRCRDGDDDARDVDEADRDRDAGDR